MRAPIWHSGAGKKAGCGRLATETWNFGVKAAWASAYFINLHASYAFSGISRDRLVFRGAGKAPFRPCAPINGVITLVRLVPIVLQKSFWADQRKFLGPLMRFARGDVRDHIASSKIDHGPSYKRYGVLQ